MQAQPRGLAGARQRRVAHHEHDGFELLCGEETPSQFTDAVVMDRTVVRRHAA